MSKTEDAYKALADYHNVRSPQAKLTRDLIEAMIEEREVATLQETVRQTLIDSGIAQAVEALLRHRLEELGYESEFSKSLGPLKELLLRQVGTLARDREVRAPTVDLASRYPYSLTKQAVFPPEPLQKKFCIRCGGEYSPSGSCSKEPCQGSVGEWPGPDLVLRSEWDEGERRYAALARQYYEMREALLTLSQSSSASDRMIARRTLEKIEIMREDLST